jgi:hypothetical protein
MLTISKDVKGEKIKTDKEKAQIYTYSCTVTFV